MSFIEDELEDEARQRRRERASTTKLRVMGLLDGWRNAHDFMYVKRRDDEEWQELIKQIRQAIDDTPVAT